MKNTQATNLSSVIRVSDPVGSISAQGDNLPKAGSEGSASERMKALVTEYVKAQREGDDIRSQFDECPADTLTHEEVEIAKAIYLLRSALPDPSFHTPRLNGNRKIKIGRAHV